MFFVVFNSFSKASILKDDFRKHFRKSETAKLHTFTRDECLKYFKVQDNDDDIVVINHIIGKLPSNSALFLDETSLARPNNSFDWSSLDNPKPCTLVLISFQPVMDITKKSSKKVKLKLPANSDNIELTRSYRFSSSVFQCLEDVLYLSNIKTINSKPEPVDFIHGCKPIRKGQRNYHCQKRVS